MKELWLPEEIEKLAAHRHFTADKVGMSDAQVLLSEDQVLKIQPQGANAERELTMLRWLEGRLPVPRVLAHRIEKGKSYCLMTRMHGRMACEEDFLDRPGWLLDRLTEALRMLWSLDFAGCPLLCSPEAELVLAREQVEKGLVDVENTEPGTFGPGGFRDPEELLTWLEEHQPPWEPAFTHGDFCLPNLFLTDSGVSGFLDLGRAGLGDFWRDIAICRRSLKHNTDGCYGVVKPGFDPDRLFDALGLRPDEEKLRWYLLLDELF